MQKKILEILTSAEDYVSGQSISEQLGISRQAVWKGINSLKERGYDIKSLQNKGYKLVSSPEHMDKCMLENLLVNNKIIGKNIIVLDSVGSTNDYLKLWLPHVNRSAEKADLAGCGRAKEMKT